LPDDKQVRDAWMKDMTHEDQYAYETALAGVRSLGPRVLGAWHAVLSWTLEDNGRWHRAASLRPPKLNWSD
jgi:hypothetical protein